MELFRARPSLAAELLGGVLGVPVPEFGARAAGSDRLHRIAECADLVQLDAWVRRAAIADTINDLAI